MKKIILSGIVAVALIASTSVMAQNVTTKKEGSKAKQEVKAETKSTKPVAKADNKPAKQTKSEVKKELKK